jgi:hypothetical protein
LTKCVGYDKLLFRERYKLIQIRGVGGMTLTGETLNTWRITCCGVTLFGITPTSTGKVYRNDEDWRASVDLEPHPSSKEGQRSSV